MSELVSHNVTAEADDVDVDFVLIRSLMSFLNLLNVSVWLIGCLKRS